MARASAGLQSHEKMLVPSVHPLLWLFVLFPGTTASANSSIHAVTAQSQSTTHSPDVKNHTSESQEKSRQELAYEFQAGDPRFLAESLSKEPSVKSTPPAHPNVTSVGPAATAKSSPVATTLLASTVQDEKSNRSRTTPAPPPQGQEPKTSKNTTTSATQGTSAPVTPTTVLSGYLPTPTPTDDKSPLTVAAFGVISFIVILIVVVIILVSVVSLRFKCNRSKDSEDKQKPGTSVVSESCSAGTSQKENSITLISMKNINTNNSRSYPPSEKVL